MDFYCKALPAVSFQVMFYLCVNNELAIPLLRSPHENHLIIMVRKFHVIRFDG